MKFVAAICIFFVACSDPEPQYPHPIIYTSEQACAEEEKLYMDSIAKISAAIDTLIARRDRLPPEKRKIYNYAVQMLSAKVNDSTLRKYMLKYQGRRLGFDPEKVTTEDANDVHYGR